MTAISLSPLLTANDSLCLGAAAVRPRGDFINTTAEATGPGLFRAKGPGQSRDPEHPAFGWGFRGQCPGIDGC